MKVYAINGGPRKSYNTAKMLESFIKGVNDEGIETEIIHLYDLKYSSCRECYGCKVKGSKNYGRCTYPDDLKGVLEKLYKADGLVFASPIYFHDITGQLRCFLDRFFFSLDSHKKGESTLIPKKIITATIYTMNETQEHMEQANYPQTLETMHQYIHYLLGYYPEIIYVYNTYEFNDYSKYKASYWDEEEKRIWQKQQFPLDLQNAYHAGKQMALKIKKAYVK